jgi:ribosomal protein S12 methylthiotransferase
MPSSKTLYIVSLGCPKNRVDSEVMAGAAAERGFRLVDDASLAEVILVNTCGFIESAKRESIEAIFEMAGHKHTGACKRLVVTGCLAQRHAGELATEIPEIDHFLGSGDLLRAADLIEGRAPRIAVAAAAGYLVRASDPRLVSTGPRSAYLKIAEGCGRRCAFCVIPQLRGKHRSRPVEDVVREAHALAAAGAVELNLVSQDTIAYGSDLAPAGRSLLAELVRRVADAPGVRWVRLMYLYPDRLDDALVELLASHPRVVPYVDMPMQHASDAVLRRMRRGHSAVSLRRTIERLRERVPGLVLRTAFIVGFPGEMDEDFAQLCDFVRWARFERMGVFRYSDEGSAPSFGFDGKVTARVSYARARRLMALQRSIARESNRRLVGEVLEALVEGPSEQHELVMRGRHAGQAPEIDGELIFTESAVRIGEVRRVRVVGASDYDVLARALEEPPIVAGVRGAGGRVRP